MPDFPYRPNMFRCSNCSHTQPKWTGKCPACGEWNALGEVPDEPKKGASSSQSSGKALPVSQISVEKSEANHRIPVASAELNNLL